MWTRNGQSPIWLISHEASSHGRRSSCARLCDAPKHIPSSMASCTKGVPQEFSSIAFLQKKGRGYSMRFTQAIAAITHRPGPWLPKLSGMDFSGLQPLQTQNKLFAHVMVARDMQDMTICLLRR